MALALPQSLFLRRRLSWVLSTCLRSRKQPNGSALSANVLRLKGQKGQKRTSQKELRKWHFMGIGFACYVGFTTFRSANWQTASARQ
jgi:hypothetical protein